MPTMPTRGPSSRARSPSENSTRGGSGSSAKGSGIRASPGTATATPASACCCQSWSTDTARCGSSPRLAELRPGGTEPLGHLGPADRAAVQQATPRLGAAPLLLQGAHAGGAHVGQGGQGHPPGRLGQGGARPSTRPCERDGRARSWAASETCSMASGPSAPSRSARVRATRRRRLSPRALSNPLASDASRNRLAGADSGVRRSTSAPDSRPLATTPRSPARARAARHPCRDDRGGFGRLGAEEVRHLGPADLDPQVEAVEQRAGQPALVPLAGRTAAAAAAARWAALPARARVRWPRPAGTGPGNVTVARARQTRTTPSSSGWRSASSTVGGNSPSSSRNSTPPWAQRDLPGRMAPVPPPMSATAEAVWCGARNGGRGTRPPPAGAGRRPSGCG